MKTSKFILLLFFYLGFYSQASGYLNIEEISTNKRFKFLFVKNCDLPKVSINISFRDSGYAYENTEKQGITWFTSLVIQEGAGKNDSKIFAKKLKDKGINLSFSTNLETFQVSLNTLSENLEDAISLLSEAITCPKVDPEGLNRIFEKAKINFNNLEKKPHFIATKQLNKLLFKNHPYSRSKYGTFDSIMRITRNDVLTYIKHNFAKDNIVISVAGCTTKKEISALLDKYLSKLSPKRSKVKKIPVKNDFGPAKNKSIFMNIPQSIILFAQKGIARENPNYYNAIVLINALGGMKLNSVIMKELRQNLGITYNANVSIVSNKHGNIITGFISTDNSTVNKAISAIKNTLSLIKKKGIDKQLFKNSKTSLINNFIFFLSNNTNTVAMLDNIQINNYNINYINDYENIINNVKLEEVKKLANSLLEPQNLFFVKVGKST